MKKFIFLFLIMTIGLFLVVSEANATGRCYNGQTATCSTSGAFGQCRTCSVCDDGTPSTCYEMQVCSACKTAAQMDDLATRRAICKCNHPNDYSTQCGNINMTAPGSGQNASMVGRGEICDAPSTGFDYNGITFEPK